MGAGTGHQGGMYTHVVRESKARSSVTWRPATPCRGPASGTMPLPRAFGRPREFFTLPGSILNAVVGLDVRVGAHLRW